MRSIAWWHFQWPWRTPNPVFKVTAFLSRISQKRCILGTKLLKSTNGKPYTVYRMIPLSMTLSDLWPRFQSHDIFEVEYQKNLFCLKDKITIAHEESVPNIWNVTMYGDLDWPVNASCGFVSISWASCFVCHASSPACRLLQWDILWTAIVSLFMGRFWFCFHPFQK